MSGTFYKGLGFVVWKAGIWYVRRRYGTAGKRAGIGVGVLTLAGIAGAIVLSQRRGEADR